jgi:hypothetical protein
MKPFALLLVLLCALGVSAKPHKHESVNRQKQPDKQRVIEIQQALILEGYMDGKPSGKWDTPTQDALAEIAREHGWSTYRVPDARVLAVLGLGSSTAGMYAPIYPPGYRNLVEEEILRFEEDGEKVKK